MNTINNRLATCFAAVVALLSGCSNVRESAPGEARSVAVNEAKDEIRAVSEQTLAALYQREPSARKAVENAAGYAVFSNFGMKILVAGGGKGEGLAVNTKTLEQIYMRMAEVQAGLGFGLKKFRLVWIFQTEDAFQKFVNSGYEFGGQATLAAQMRGQGAALAGAASVSPGVWVYQLTDEGLAAELTVKGTKYYRDKELNAAQP